MRQHKGMRPQDIAILLKIIAKEDQAWQNKDLAAELLISPSEISESLHRSLVAGLINAEKKKVHRLSLLEFIQFGLPYVFPTAPGAIVNGIPTAHSHPFMRQFISSDTLFVWPFLEGRERGQSVEPLYKDAAEASQLDGKFYKLLALADVVRVGKSRELTIAIKELKKSFEK